MGCADRSDSDSWDIGTTLSGRARAGRAWCRAGGRSVESERRPSIPTAESSGLPCDHLRDECRPPAQHAAELRLREVVEGAGVFAERAHVVVDARHRSPRRCFGTANTNRACMVAGGDPRIRGPSRNAVDADDDPYRLDPVDNGGEDGAGGLTRLSRGIRGFPPRNPHPFAFGCEACHRSRHRKRDLEFAGRSLPHARPSLRPTRQVIAPMPHDARILRARQPNHVPVGVRARISRVRGWPAAAHRPVRYARLASERRLIDDRTMEAPKWASGSDRPTGARCGATNLDGLARHDRPTVRILASAMQCCSRREWAQSGRTARRVAGGRTPGTPSVLRSVRR